MIVYRHKFLYGDIHDMVVGGTAILLSYISIAIMESILGSTVTWAALWPLTIFSRAHILTDREVFPMLQAEIIEDEPVKGGVVECMSHSTFLSRKAS